MVTQNSSNEKTGASGKVMQGQGVGTASDFSTATYPSTATGTGKVLIADGTNWVASTPTYPSTAGTSGNVLTSDGTNINSTAYKGYLITLQTAGGSLADATTYYLETGEAVTDETASGSARTRFYIPVSGTITTCYGNATSSLTEASAGNCTVAIRLNNTTSTNVTTTLSMTNPDNPFNNTGLSIAVTAGDFIEFLLTTPTWATNPNSIRMTITVLIV